MEEKLAKRPRADQSGQAEIGTRRPLPFKKEHRTNPAVVGHSAFAMVRGYLSNGLSRRSREGRVAEFLEHEFARFRGYDSLSAVPITARVKVKLGISLMLFLAVYEPEADSKAGGKTMLTALNSLNRIMSELGMDPAQRPPKSLGQYLAEIEAEGKQQ